MTSSLLSALENVEKRAKTTKWQRFLANPWAYIQAIGFRTMLYPWTKKGRLAEAPLFFGGKMSVLLPAATDIYLTGGKTHDSEIRLARFMIQHLPENGFFLDIGAHFGYFSRLAALLVGRKGHVRAFEAAQATFELLAQNTADCPQIVCQQAAVYDTAGEVRFYEFPILYSEYNTAHTHQYTQEKWFKKIVPIERRVPAVTLADVLTTAELIPNIIKIDVEGAEYQVIRGLEAYLETHDFYIVMEFVDASRGNQSHRDAQTLLLEKGFNAYSITPTGFLAPIGDIEAYLAAQHTDSDNIVFYKK